MRLESSLRSAARVLAALALVTLSSRPARAAKDALDPGTTWLYLRAGYAKSSADGAGNAGGGYGFGFRHMLRPGTVCESKILGFTPLAFMKSPLFNHWSFGGFVEYDVLGRYGSASEIEVPVAVDLTRHGQWKSAARPYIGFGVGPWYRKTYQTGNDFSRVSWTGFVTGGFDAALAPSQFLGFDVRLAVVDSENKPINPVFGSGGSGTHTMDTPSGPQTVVDNPQAIHWSVKLAYSFTY